MAMKIISEGAEARIYSGNFLGIRVAVKERVSKAYRVRELDSSIISQRTRSEARIMALASSAGVPVPGLVFIDGNRISMELLDGTTLNRLIGRMPAKRLSRVMSKLGGCLALLHNIGIAHGDYTPANALVGRDGVHVIDFGLSSVTNSVEDKALDLLLMKRSVDRVAFSSFLYAYKKVGRESGAVLERLADIEGRGRYQNRSLE